MGKINFLEKYSEHLYSVPECFFKRFQFLSVWTLDSCPRKKKGPWILGNEMKVDFRNEGQETESKISARPRGLGRLDGVNAPSLSWPSFLPATGRAAPPFTRSSSAPSPATSIHKVRHFPSLPFPSRRAKPSTQASCVRI